jgi:O-antigen ligase
MARAAINMFKEKPLLGVGVGNYGYIYNKYKAEYAPRFEFLVKTHNAFLEILAETGLVGFALFFSWLALNFLPGIGRAFIINNKGSKLVLTALICSFMGILVHGLALGIFMHSHTWLMLGLILAGERTLEG